MVIEPRSMTMRGLMVIGPQSMTTRTLMAIGPRSRLPVTRLPVAGDLVTGYQVTRLPVSKQARLHGKCQSPRVGSGKNEGF